MKENTTPQDNPKQYHATNEKILLGLLPYWTPLTPPLGISCLKSFLQQHGYKVKTVDLNTGITFKEIYEKYFNTLREYSIGTGSGNFINIGHDVLQNHLMAYLNKKDEESYLELIKTLIARNYYCHIDGARADELDKITGQFYALLETHFLNLLAKEKPTVLGLSVYRGTLPASLFAFKLARENYPEIKTVMGGAIFSQEFDMDTPNMKRLLESTPYIDHFIIGEGEILFLKLLQNRLPPSKKVYTLMDIHKKYLELDSGSVPIPDFQDFDNNQYLYVGTYTSRSCPFQCKFCSETVYWGEYRKKSGKQIVEELGKLYQKYNRQLFLMCDSLLNPVLTDLANESIESNISFYWDGYLRVNQQVCNLENTLLWRRGGFYRARLGIESGSQRVLDLMAKKITVDQVKKAIFSLAYAGIKTTTYWVIGYPGEAEEDFQQTLNLIEEVRDDIYEAECNHFRYFLSGQVNSAEWVEKKKYMPLYPENAVEMLLLQTWILDGVPTRAETMERVNRFNAHCHKLGIPNPYSLEEINKADERWRKNHKNAVPPLVEFMNRESYINEKKYVKKLLSLQNKLTEDNDFCF